MKEWLEILLNEANIFLANILILSGINKNLVWEFGGEFIGHRY